MFLHVYAQDHEHDTSWIVGDKQSLTALRDAIDNAISSEDLDRRSKSLMSFTSDGEGFITVVIVVEDKETKNNMILPYSKIRAYVKNVITDVSPYDLVSAPGVYKKLHLEPDFK